jgi:hypothetical protein
VGKSNGVGVASKPGYPVGYHAVMGMTDGVAVAVLSGQSPWQGVGDSEGSGQPIPRQGVGGGGVREVGVRVGQPVGVGVGEAVGQPIPSQGVGTMAGQSGVGEGKSAGVAVVSADESAGTMRV